VSVGIKSLENSPTAYQSQHLSALVNPMVSQLVFQHLLWRRQFYLELLPKGRKSSEIWWECQERWKKAIQLAPTFKKITIRANIEIFPSKKGADIEIVHNSADHFKGEKKKNKLEVVHLHKSNRCRSDVTRADRNHLQIKNWELGFWKKK